MIDIFCCGDVICVSCFFVIWWWERVLLWLRIVGRVGRLILLMYMEMILVLEDVVRFLLSNIWLLERIWLVKVIGVVGIEFDG